MLKFLKILKSIHIKKRELSIIIEMHLHYILVSFFLISKDVIMKRKDRLHTYSIYFEKLKVICFF